MPATALILGAPAIGLEHKCEFVIAGMRLIDHAIAAVREQVSEVAVCGRQEPSLLSLPDRPTIGLGPLGGLNAALHHAAEQGYEGVLSTPVDVYPLPRQLIRKLRGSGPAHLTAQHTVGYWPAELAGELEDHLLHGHRSVRSWILSAQSRSVDDSDLALLNINRRRDLRFVKP